MKRSKSMLVGAACVWIAAAAVASAQPVKVHRIGFLSPASRTSMATRVDTYRATLRDLGYVEGRNAEILFRWADGSDERMPALAAELVTSGVDILVVHGVAAVQAALKASAALPVLCFSCGDFLSTGLVTSLARPGGTVTGLTIVAPDVSGKRLELLRTVAPGIRRVAVVWNRGNPVSVQELRETEMAARAMGIEVESVGVTDVASIDASLTAASGRADALIMLSDAMLYGRQAQIAARANELRLPSISYSGDFAKAGGLMGYGPDLLAIAARAAVYTDKILKGARPGELPIEQPTKFEFVINQGTARTLGLALAPSLLMRADTVIP